MPSGWLWHEDEETGKITPVSSVSNTESSRKRDSSADRKIGADTEHAISVSQLNQWIKNTLDRTLYPVWIEAEISDLAQPSSGHFYMTLKDAQSTIRGVMWRTAAQRLPFRLEDGVSVLCFGSLDVYSPRGTYQFIVQKMQPKGIGPLQLAFQQLHAKLSREGLFDPDRKKALPPFPRRIGFVTSPTGAAIHDFLEVLRRRWRGIEVIVIPAKVQGEGAAEEIAKGIRVAGRIDPPLDVLIVGRGGGSIEDLWSFNEEVVVRALAACPIPTVSAVGHEIDVTLSDLAADVRALTPTEAAERILPDAEELNGILDRTKRHLLHLVQNQLLASKRRLEQISSRPVLSTPEQSLHRLYQRLDELQLRMERGLDRGIENHKQRMIRTIATLEALSPLRVMGRGYSVTRKAEGRGVVRTVGSVKPGDWIETILEDGTILSQVQETNQNEKAL